MSLSAWTFTDHQDSVRDFVSGTGANRGQVVEHRQYDSFCKIVRRTTGPQPTAPATAGFGIGFGYAGRPLEARTGLSDNRARWYEPGTGKFINEDPSGFKGADANLFRYAGNDPLNQVDPSGLVAKWASYGGGRLVNNQMAATSSSNVPNGSLDAPYRTGISIVASSSGQAEGNAYLASGVFQEMRYGIYKSLACVNGSLSRYDLSFRDFPGHPQPTSQAYLNRITPSSTSWKGLRLDYSPNVKTGGSINWHWNQTGAYEAFGIADHSIASPTAARFG